MIWQIQSDDELDKELWYLGQDSSDDRYLLTVLKVEDLAESSDFKKDLPFSLHKVRKNRGQKVLNRRLQTSGHYMLEPCIGGLYAHIFKTRHVNHIKKNTEIPK